MFFSYFIPRFIAQHDKIVNSLIKITDWIDSVKYWQAVPCRDIINFIYTIESESADSKAMKGYKELNSFRPSHYGLPST